MADGLMYPTGMGSQTVDFATPASNYFNSYVDQKLKEIDEKKVRATDYEKKVLKAMSVQAIPEMSGKLRDKYNDKITSYKDEITQRLQKSGGKPSTADEIFIEENGVKLQNEMLMEKNKLDKFVELRKNFSNQTFMNETVNADSYTRDYAKLYDDFMAGKDIDDPDIVMMKNLKPVTSEKYISANYPNVMKNIPVRTGLKTEGGKIVLETSADIEKANQYFNDLYDRDEMLNQRFANNPEGKQKEIDSIIETNSINKVEERRLPTTGKTGSGSGGASIKNIGLIETEYGQTKSQGFIPMKATASTKTLYDATNEDTGRKEKLDKPLTATLVGVDHENGKIVFRTYEGGVSKTDKGETLYINENAKDEKYADQKAGSKTKKDVESSAKDQLDSLKDSGFEDVEVKDIKTAKDGTITITGIQYKNLKNKGKDRSGLLDFRKYDYKEEPITKTLIPLQDPKGETTYSIPLTEENLSTVSDEIRNYRIDGMTLKEYIKKNPTGSKNKTEASTSDSEVKLSSSGGVKSMGRDVNSVQKILDANKHKNFVKRILKRGTVPSFDRGGGISSSHSMAYAESDGKYYVFPTVVEKNGKLVDLASEDSGEWDAFDYAIKNKGAIAFDNEQDAKWFSENYKRVWGEEFAPNGSGNAPDQKIPNVFKRK